MSTPLRDSVSLRTRIQLDYETKKEYNLELRARNLDEPLLTGLNKYTTDISYKIIVQNINDNPPTFTSEHYSVNVAENSPSGSYVMNLSAEDKDGNSVLTYELIGKESRSIFAINNITGEIRLINTLDRETSDLHTLFVIVSDGMHFDDAEVDVTVTDINDNNPIFAESSLTLALSESTVTNSVILTIIATDLDLGNNGTLKYSITSGNTGETFAIGPSDGNLRLQTALNYENVKIYNLQISVTDDGNPTARSSLTMLPVTVNVRDINDNNPIFIKSFYTETIPDSTAVGDQILVVEAADADGTIAYNQLSYNIVDAVATQYFQILSNGTLLLKSLDYDLFNEYRFAVEASDGKKNTSRHRTANVVIKVTDTNNLSPVFQTPTYNITISEGRLIGASVIKVTAIDNDRLGKLTYKLINSNTAIFKVNPQSGEIMLVGNLDRENEDTYVLTVSVEDGIHTANPPATVIVNLADINDNAPVFTNTVYTKTVPEDILTTALILTVQATDSDMGTNAQLDYAIVTNVLMPSSLLFTVNANGEVFTRTALDFETKSVHKFQVVATDKGGKGVLKGYANVIISLSDVNDNAPVFTMENYKVNVTESARINTPLVFLEASDTDTNELLTYTITGGTSIDNFGIIGNKIILVQTLDYEAIQTHTLTVVVKDRKGTSCLNPANVVIDVVEVNDNRPILPTYFKVRVKEDLPSGTSILKVNATDNDKGTVNKMLKFSLNNTSDFLIDINTGDITAVSLDYERQKLYSLVVIVKDMGEPYLEATMLLEIEITDVNDVHPIFMPSRYAITISEKAPAGMIIFNILATDSDTSTSSLSYTSNNLITPFSMNSTSGAITIVRSLNSETGDGFYNFTIDVSDGDLVSTSPASVSITIIDVNDNEPVFDKELYVFSVSEDKPIDTNIGNLIARDNDTTSENNAFIYSIISSDDFKLNGSNILTNRLFDYENITRYQFEIQAINTKSQDRLTGKTLVVIDVVDVNDNTPVVSSPIVNLNISETTSVGSVIFTIFASDADSGRNGELSFAMSDQTFTIDDSGVIRLSRQLDQLFKSTYKLNIVVSDKGINPTKSTTATVNIKVFPPTIAGIVFDNCPYRFNIDENSLASNAYTYRQLTVRDKSTYQTAKFTFFVVAGAADIASVIDVSIDGRISMLAQTDYETRNRYDFLVKVTNERGAKDYCYVTANILDVNEHPVVSLAFGDNVNVSESTPPYTTIYSINASDPDSSHTNNGLLGYNLISHTDVFGVDQLGRIFLKRRLDYENVTQYAVTIITRDKGDKSKVSVDQLNVNVLDWNDNRPIIINKQLFISASENSKPGNSLTISIQDVDDNSNGQIEYVGIYPTGILEVDKTTGVVSVIGNLDYEQQQVHKLVVVVKDMGTPYLQSYRTITLNVLNTNDNNPSFPIEVYVISVSKLAGSGTSILTVQAKDADEGVHGTIASYEIVSGNTTVFSIDNDGVIKIISKIDPAITSVKQYTLRIRATDGGNPPNLSSNNASVTINVVDYDGPQFMVNSYTIDLLENEQMHNNLTEITATSASPNALFSYQIIADATRTDYNYFRVIPQNNKAKIQPTKSFDYEVKRYYSFLVEVTDVLNGMKNHALVAVKIIDTNDNYPQILSRMEFNLTENTLPGSTVVALYATDADDGLNGEVVFSADGGDGMNVFEVTGTGEVLLTGKLSSNKNIYGLLIKASDKGTPSRVSTTNLVFYVHEAYATITKQDVTFPEDTIVGTVLLTIGAVDSYTESNDGFRYSLVGSIFSDKFSVSTNGQVTLRTPLNYESSKEHSIVVMAKGPTSSAVDEIIISVTDVNDESPIFLTTSYSINLNENTVPNQRLLKVQANDGDSSLNGNNRLTYSFETRSTNDFSIDENTGVVTIVNSLDVEKRVVYQLIIIATDNGSPKLQSRNKVTVTISLIDVNDNIPLFNSSLYQIDVNETSPPNTLVLTVKANDRDLTNPNKQILYSISQPFAKQFFKIDPVSGTIRLRQQLDYETTTKYDFAVIATDQGNVAYTGIANVEVTVVDFPDLVPQFSPLVYNISIPESTLVGTPITKLSVVESVTNLQFTIINGNNESKFVLGRSNGILVLQNRLDREVTDSYQLTAIVYGYNGSSLSTIIIKVIDVNDNVPTPLNAGCIQGSVTEGGGSNTRVADVAASDKDLDNNAKLSFTFTPACPLFEIQQTTGAITTTGALDYEAEREHKCLIKISDQGSPQLSGFTCMHVTVLDINDNNPVFSVTNYNVEIKESALVGSVLISVTATDNDSGTNGKVFYEIVNGDITHFSVDNLGQITLIDQLNYEVERSYELTIQARDGSVTDRRLSNPHAVIKVNVTEVNDNRPVFTQSYYQIRLDENTTKLSMVLQLSAVDNDAGPLTNELIFESLENTTDFTMNSSGAIIVKQSLDYERQKTYALIAIVKDKGIPYLSSTALIDIIIADINDVAPIFTVAKYNIIVSEKAPVGQTLAVLQASDVDTQLLSYSYSGPGASMNLQFRLEGNKLILNKPFDWEARQVFTLNFKVNDGIQDGKNTAVVSIQVVDVNDNQPRFDLNIYDVKISEGQSSSFEFLTVQATDNDTTTPNSALTYSIDPSTDSGNFSIRGQTLRTEAKFDYEKIKMYSFHVVATDNSTADKLQGRALVRVHIQDVNDNPPIPEESNMRMNISEGTFIGANIVTIRASDADSTSNGELVYQLTHSVFSIQQNGDIRLKKQLNAFVNPSYKLTVNISDRGQPSKSSLVAINIDVFPVKLPGIKFTGCPFEMSVVENDISSTFSEILSIIDTGVYRSTDVKYSIVSGDRGIFVVDTNGTITVESVANYESQERYSFLVKAVNERGASSYCLVNGNINDTNEAPSFNFPNFVFNVSECTEPSTVVYIIQSKDPDSNAWNNRLSYSLVLAGTEAARKFSIDDDGRIQIIQKLDYEKLNSYKFKVMVKDSGVPPHSSTASVNVNVLDCNDNRPILAANITTISISENTKPQNIIFVTAQDLDSTTNKQIEFVAIFPEGILTIHNQTGVVSVIGDLDYETRQSYQFLVTAKDLGTPSLRSTLTLFVSVINENDNDPVFPDPIYTVSISRKSTVGTTIVRVVASDDDLGQFGEISKYKILSGNVNNNFKINEKGNVILQNSLNMPPYSQAQYVLNIQALDSGSPPRSSKINASLTINIVNYTQPYFSLESYIFNLRENNKMNTTTFEISATSNVSPPTLTYEIVVDSKRTDYNSFALVNQDNTAQIQPTESFDFETQRNYSFLVKVKDALNQENSALIFVQVIDVNDNTPQILNVKRKINITGHTLIGSTVVTLFGMDSDSGINKQFDFATIGGDGKDVFTVAPTGEIMLSKDINADIKSTYQILVSLTDKGSPPKSSSISLVIYVHKTTAIVNASDIILPENTVIGSELLKVSAMDPNTKSNFGFVYSLVGPVSNTLFSINPTTGVVTLRSSLDYEKSKQHSIVVKAKGPTSNGVDEIIVVVTDVNDEKPMFLSTSYAMNLNENAVRHQRLLKVQANDGDSSLNGNNHLTYAFETQSTNDFSIDENTGVVTIVNSLDVEKRVVYQLIIIATDNGSPKLQSTNKVTFKISLIDVNDNMPIFNSSLYQIAVNETSPPNTVVLTVTANDRDLTNPNKQILYSINQPFAKHFFKIDPVSGTIRLRQQLDYETTMKYDFAVIATDQGNVSYTGIANVEVTVVDFPDLVPQFSPLLYNITIRENTLVGTSIAKLSVVESVTNLLFTIYGDSERKFFLGQSDGIMVLKQKLDYEVNTSYRLTAMVSDGVNFANIPATINIYVLDVNDNVPTFSEVGCYQVSRNETASIGIFIITAEAKDPDSGNNKLITYSSSCPSLQIHPQTGRITTATLLDYEKEKIFTCIIEAKDQGQPPLTGFSCVTVSIIDANDEKPIFERLAYIRNIKESANVGSIITRVMAYDADSYSNAAFRYIIKEGNVGEKFNIDNNGFITLKSNLDYERLNRYTFEIQAVDISNSSIVSNPNAIVRINVIDVNDNRPAFRQPYYSTTIPESTSIDTSVLKLEGIDEDIDVQTAQILFISLYNTTDFVVDNNTGVIRVSRDLNYEIKTVYHLVAAIKDQGSPFLMSTTLVDIFLSDANDNQPIFMPQVYNVSLSEKAPLNARVTTVAATDQDSGLNGEITYSITEGNTKNKFKINNDGVIMVDGDLNAENTKLLSYALTITATDKSSLPQPSVNNASVMILVKDVNDNQPVFTVNPYIFNIREDISADVYVGSVSASDNDLTINNNRIRYRILANADSGNFSITLNGSLHRAPGASIDYENIKLYSFEVEAVDNGAEALKGTSLVRVYITDVNDNNPVAENTEITLNVSEATLLGSSILRIYATDIDSGNNGKLSYTLSGDGNGRFLVDDNGELTLVKQLDSSAEARYDLTVLIKDYGIHVRSTIVKVIIRVHSIDFTPLQFIPACPRTFIIKESLLNGEIGRVVATDTENYTSKNLVYSIESGLLDVSGIFLLNRTTGALIQEQAADYEIRNRYEIMVCAGNENVSRVCCSVVIKITDVNEPPFFMNHTNGVYSTSITETTPINTFVYSVMAYDNDNRYLPSGQLSFSLQSPSGQQLPFSIDNNGNIKTIDLLDRESQSSYLYNVTVSDQNAFPLRSTIIMKVTIIDYNDLRPVINPIPDVVFAENISGRTVGQVNAVDDDYLNKNKGIRYSVLPKGILNVSPSGVLTVAKKVDYEKFQSYKLFVVAQDTGSPYLSSMRSFNVNITNINDNAPFFRVSEYNITISEKITIGTIILSLYAEDNDLGTLGNIASYNITSGDRSKFNIDKTGKLTLVSTLNWRLQNKYYLQIIAVDFGRQASTTPVTVTISIADISDLQPYFLKNLYVHRIAEGTYTNSRLLAVSATSNEPINGPLEYEIIPDLPETMNFIIDTTAGIISTNGLFDYETKNTYTFNVEVKDRFNSKTNRAIVNIYIDDINDNNPQFSGSNRMFNITEFTLPGSTVSTISATDKDSNMNGQIQYRSVGGDGEGILFVNQDGKITLNKHIYYDFKNQYTLNVQAYDLGVPPRTAVVTLTYNIDKAYATVSTTDVEVAENTTVGSYITKVSSTDPFTGTSFGVRYFLIGRSSTFFGINETSGIIRLTRSLDRESIDKHVLTIQSRGPSAGGVGELMVTVADNNDNKPVFNSPSYQVRISETALIGQTIITVTASDKDLGTNAALKYFIISANTNIFGINSQTGDVTLKMKLDYEAADIHVVRISVQDKGLGKLRASQSASVIVFVQDYNDNCPQFTKDNYLVEFQEPGVVGTKFVTLNTIDLDQKHPNNKVICSIDEPIAVQYFTMTSNCSLILKRNVDYEQQKEFKFVVKATDQGVVSCQATSNIVVRITDITDTKASFSPVNYNITISESTLIGTLLLALNVISTASSLRYSLQHVSDIRDLKTFGMNQQNGVIFLSRAVDYETKSKYFFTASVNDGVNNGINEANIQINILNVDDNTPYFSRKECYKKTLQENVPIGTRVVDVFAYDLDGDELIYSLVPSVSCYGLAVNANTGYVMTSANFDFESRNVIHCLIKADRRERTDSMSGYTCMTIIISNVNDKHPVFATSFLNVSVQESAPINTLIASLYAFDEDNTNLLYNLISGNVNNQFSINSDGEISLNGKLDYENIKSYVIQIQATDDGNPKLSSIQNAVVYVTVTEVNDNRPQFLRSYYQTTIPENLPIGATVISVKAVDNDGVRESLSYSVLANTTDFLIDSNTGAITVARQLDYELHKDYVLIVIVQDIGSPYLSSRTLVDISLSDINDNKPVFNPNQYNVEVSEKALVGASVVTVHATDVDDTFIVYAITLLSGVHGFFRMDGNVIKVNQSLDFEKVNQRKYSMNIEATDSRGLKAINSAFLQINVRDINDREPVFDLSHYAINVPENNDISKMMLSVSASDSDGTAKNSNIVYSIVDNTVGDSVNFRLTSNGILYSKIRFDYETKRMYQFNIKASDTGDDNLTATAVVVVNIDDKNDNYPIPEKTLIIVNVSDAMYIFSIVAVIFCKDQDSGVNAMLRYKITNPKTTSFAINNNGVIRLFKMLDYFEQNFYNITVVVSDQGSPNLHSYVNILISVHKIKLPEIQFTLPHYIFVVEENTVKDFIGRIKAKDTGLYRSQRITYEVESGHAIIANIFTLVADSLSSVVLQIKPADYDTRRVYNFVVKAMNEREATDYTHITINIKDVNENPYFVGFTHPNSYQFSISEVVSVPSFIYSVNAKDDDSGLNGEIEYELISNFQNGNVTIDQYGRIQVHIDPNHEFISSYQFQVIAKDKGVPSLRSDSATILIYILDYNDNRPIFHQTDPYIVSIPEGAEVNGTDIGAVFAKDRDSGLNGVVKYTGVYPKGTLLLNRDNGIITLIKPLDYELGVNLEFVVVAQDLGEPYLSSQIMVVIDLINKNEAPIFHIRVYNISISEKIPVGFKVLKVIAEDEDIGGAVLGYSMSPLPYIGSTARGADNTFVIDNEGAIYVNEPLDSKVRNYYIYTLQARDNGSPQLLSIHNATVHLHITYYSEKRPEFHVNPYIAEVNEDVSLSAIILNISANTSEDNGGPLTYRVLSGDTASFHIEKETGVLSNSILFDYERKRSYAFEAEVEDHSNGRIGRTMVLVYIRDVNDNVPKISNLVLVYNISQSTAVGSVVATLSGSDRDSGQNAVVSFAQVDGNDRTFYVNNRGYVILRRKLDTRLKIRYNLIIEVEDHGTPSLSSNTTITINVLPGNTVLNTPKFETHHYITTCVNEGTRAGNLLTVNAINSDPISTTTMTYILAGNSIEREHFQINDVTGIISLIKPLDYESKTTHNFLVTALNNEGSRDVSTVTVCVNDIDDNKPVFLPSLVNVNISEREDVGYEVYQLTILDADINNFNAVREFKIVQGNFPVTFEVDANGAITLAKKVDMETLPTPVFNLRIRLTEGLWVVFASVTARVTDWNDNHPKFNTVGERYEFNVSETRQVGDIIEILTAIDVDVSEQNSMITYSLLTTEIDFEMRKSPLGHGALLVKRSLDYTRKNRYEMVAIATDKGYLNLVGAARVIVNIIDANNHIPQFSPINYQNTISEAAPIGTTVLKISAEDLDTGVGGKILYTIQDLTATFKVGDDGSIILIKPLDFETKKTFNFTVTARDGGNLHAQHSAQLFLTVVDVNDNEPVFDLKYYHKSIRENIIVGSSILTFNAQDSDHIGNSVRYSLISNGDSNSFLLNNTTGVLTVVSPLDYEIKKVYTFNIRAQDSANRKLIAVTHVTVDVIDVNDNAPSFVDVNTYEISVIENINMGTLLIVVSAIDQDSGNNRIIRYNITGGNDDRKFMIEDGHIRLIGKLDYQIKKKYTLNIVATDGGKPQLFSSNIVTVHVIKYNESVPMFQKGFYSIPIPENRPVNSVPLMTFVITKTLPGSPVTLSFHPGTVFEEFNLRGNDLLLAGSLDFETKRSYDILVLATDHERDMALATVRIVVQNLNEHAPKFTRPIYQGSVPELAYIGHSVLALTATDRDGDSLYYSVVGNVPGDAFQLSDKNVVVNSRLITGTYEFNVVVNDRTFQSSVSKVSIIVTAVFKPIFPDTTYIVSVLESTENGSIILSVVAGDHNQGITYSIESIEAREVFGVNSTGK